MTRSKFIREAREKFLDGLGVPEQQPFKPDPFQLQAVSCVANGIDTLVSAPTGSGKTYIAIESIRNCLNRGLRAVYTTPLKALSNTKFNEFRSIFEPEHSVGLLTGDRKIETDASVVIATAEIYRNELYQEHARYSLVVLDEVHFIADQQRGAVWEESIILTPKDSTLLMLSASISNPFDISEWLLEVRKKECEVIIEKERPVELRHGFIHPQYGVIPLSDNRGNIIREVRDFYSQKSSGSGGNKGGGGSRGRKRSGGRGRKRK